jgi:hypothetical protein
MMKEAEGEGIAEKGASGHTGDSITINSIWQNKTKNSKR